MSMAANPVNWLVALAGSVLAHFLLFLAWDRLTRGEPAPVDGPPIKLSAAGDAPGNTFIVMARDSLDSAELASVPYASAASYTVPKTSLTPAPTPLSAPSANETGQATTPEEVGAVGSAGSGRVSFFGVAAEGQRIAYVIDASASMGKNGRFAVAARELSVSLQRLPSTNQFQIIIYNDTPRFLLSGGLHWHTPTADRQRDVAAALADLAPEGRTEHAAALRLALLLQPRPEVIYWLTDGDDLRAEQVRALMADSRGTVIHVVTPISAPNP